MISDENAIAIDVAQYATSYCFEADCAVVLHHIHHSTRRVPAGPKPPRCLLPRRRSYDDAIVWEINLGLRRQRQLLPPSAPLPASRARLSTFLTQLHVMGGKGWDPRLPSSTLNPTFTALVVEPTWHTLRGLFFFCVA